MIKKIYFLYYLIGAREQVYVNHIFYPLIFFFFP